jgi:DegV family protein with EDD domain
MVESGRIRIITDSVSDLPKSVVDQYNIKLIPIYVTINDKNIRDEGTLDTDWFYKQLSTISSKPKTAAPSPQEFLQAYRKLAAEGARDIIGLFASASISSIFNHATIAAQEFYGADIHLIDTQQISMGLGWIIVLVAQALQNGATIEDITELVDDLRKRTYVLGVLDSIDYLHKSGRVGWTSAYMGDILRIKPVISFHQGEAKLVRKIRSQSKALKYVVDMIESWGSVEQLSILHSNAKPELVARMQALLSTYMVSMSIPVVKIGSVFASHVGPGCVGVAFVRTGDC